MTFKVGDRVRDLAPTQFGKGTVVGVNATGDDVRVRFDNFAAYEDSPGEQDWHGRNAAMLELIQSETAVNLNFEQRVQAEVAKIADLLISKNRKYGDSALNPVRTFSKADSVEQIKVRIDDKLSRIQRGQGDDEDTVTDLIGYLIMLKIAEAQ